MKRDPQAGFGFLITDVSRLLRRNFDRRVQSLGLTQAQWRAIAHLERNEGTHQAALAESLEIQPITLTRLIDRMQAAGWVRRSTDPEDRRAVRLYLTEKSRPVLEEMHKRAADTLEEALAGMSVAARNRLIEGLTAVKENLAAVEAAARGNGANERTGKNVARRNGIENANRRKLKHSAG